jgi:hypothetical protein
MFKYALRILFITIAITGCSDYELVKIEDPIVVTFAPEIEVDPLNHDFGALSAGSETQDIVVTVENLGNSDLNLSNIYLHNNSKFTLTSIPIGIVEPLDSVEIVASYSPETYEINSDIISILSNDEDEPEVQVVLGGSGDAPIVYIDPEYYDFGTIYLGCDDVLDIKVGNIGNSNLIISDLEYFSSIPDDFAMRDYLNDYGALPITIAPGGAIYLEVEYIPLDILDDSAYIEVTSNDPATPIAYSDHDGLGDYEGWALDNFTQDGEVSVDILFVIDNSGSMYSNQLNLKNNFDSFINAFGTAGVDYQIALITTDNASFVGDIITSSTADPVTEFNDQVDTIGTHGSAYERGLLYAYNATSGAGDASPTSSTGFFREPARLVVVYVSDEPDGGGSSMTPSDHSAHLLSLKSSSDLIVAHAVAGDYPSGCSGNGGAQFGDGYYDVVSDLGGTFMSICATDWSVTMDTLARDSMAIMSFPLSDMPIEDTISVSVDSVSSTDWIYDSSANSITFTVAPSDGSSIDVEYAIYAECN